MSVDESDGTVLYEVEDRVATVTLNRPERRNAFTKIMLRECRDSLITAEESDEVRCIVLTGAGKSFCSGGDVSGMENPPTATETKMDLWKGMQAIPRVMAAIDKPIVAMVNGDAVGGGMDLALMCDLRVAADDARFSEGYVRLGLVPGDGGAYFLPRLTSLCKALELLLTGDFITAPEAESWGIINRSVAREDLESVTGTLARKLASLPPLAVEMTKRMTYQSLDMGVTGALDLASSHVAALQASVDHAEAVEAFRDRRDGNYIGR